MHDVVEQLVRCYTVPPRKPRKGGKGWSTPLIERSEEERELQELLRPWGGWCLVLSYDPTAAVGACALYGVDRKARIRRYRAARRRLETVTRHEVGVDTLEERWLFYDADVLTPSAVQCVERYAAAH